MEQNLQTRQKQLISIKKQHTIYKIINSIYVKDSKLKMCLYIQDLLQYILYLHFHCPGFLLITADNIPFLYY